MRLGQVALLVCKVNPALLVSLVVLVQPARQDREVHLVVAVRLVIWVISELPEVLVPWALLDRLDREDRLVTREPVDLLEVSELPVHRAPLD